MPKNIVLLSDGTGNAASRVWRTNVWRFFQAVDLTNGSQVACYDDGVGTSAFKPLAILGGAFGWGLKRNVLDLYEFLCRNYKTGDDIYALGFSRGSFTIRVVMGVVGSQGIVQANSEAELERLAKEAYRAYRAERFHTLFRVETVFRAVRDVILGVKNKLTGASPYDKHNNIQPPEIRFIGVWDTVAAYGLPIDEMTRGISLFLWPMEFKDRVLSSKVKRACHALALDDERTTFHPVLWTELNESPAKTVNGAQFVKDERISQVWFPGVHSNVGGGYPDDSLANVSLAWMMKEAQHCGLRFKLGPNADPDAMLQAISSRDKDGRIYDSRQGLGGYYRYGPRKLALLCDMRFSQRQDDAVKIATPKIHESAFERGLNGAHVYGPIGLPAQYAVVMDTGQILEGPNNPFEKPAHSAARADAQEHIWNLVWWRRVVYFATLAASAHLALFPLLYKTDRAYEVSTPLKIVPQTVRMIGAFVPNFFDWWLDSFAANPGTFLIAAIAVGLLLWGGMRLGLTITDRMRTLWRAVPANMPALPTDILYSMRSSPPYQMTLGLFKRWLIPIFSVIAIVYGALTLGNHLLFDAQDGFGRFCRSEGTQAALNPNRPEPTLVAKPFRANAGCFATGVVLTKGVRYEIAITRTSSTWVDGSPFGRRFETDLNGFQISELPSVRDRVALWLGLPLRRVILQPWFRVIARIGEKGTDEYFINPENQPVLGKSDSDQLIFVVRPRRDGELFLYVNEAVIGWPKHWDVFYRHNEGEAKVEIKRHQR
jgi:uncharacterized protein (DUF2235 family)